MGFRYGLLAIVVTCFCVGRVVLPRMLSCWMRPDVCLYVLIFDFVTSSMAFHSGVWLWAAIAQTPLGAPQMCDDVRTLFILTHIFDLLWCVFLVSAGISFHLAACSTSSPSGNLVDGLPLVAILSLV